MKYRCYFVISMILFLIGVGNLFIQISFGKVFVSCEETVINSAPCYLKYDLWFSIVFIGVAIILFGFSLGNIVNKYFKENPKEKKSNK